jgi:hypothetical protein
MKFVTEIFNSLNTLQKWLVVVIVSIVLYLVTAGISFSLFSSKVPGVVTQNSGGEAGGLPAIANQIDEDPALPRTEACPLNGSLKTQQAKDAWSKRRPLAVMIENHEESRPQSGLSSADVVYEAVAEGGITRFMAVFLCPFNDIQVGPVRSARTYFLDWVSEYNSLYAHVGGANTPGPANALGQIIDYKILDLNQFGIGFPTFWRDYQRLGHPVATEHTMYSSTNKLWDYAAKKGWGVNDLNGAAWDKNYVPWKFVDGKPGSGTVNKINVTFWESQNQNYGVEWVYDSGCNCYKRFNGGKEHMDLNVNRQIAPSVVIVRFQKESRANDGYENNAHLIYGNKGTGRAIVFQNGQAIEGTWSKTNRLAREKFLDKNGKEIELVKGQIWLETVPDGSPVTY